MADRVVEVSYHRTVNLGNYNNAHLGGKIVRPLNDNEGSLEIYEIVQQELARSVDAFCERILKEATITTK